MRKEIKNELKQSKELSWKNLYTTAFAFFIAYVLFGMARLIERGLFSDISYIIVLTVGIVGALITLIKQHMHFSSFTKK